MQNTHRHGLALLLLLAMLLAAFLVMLARSAAGQPTPGLRPDPANGRRVAETLCSSCHLVGSQGGGSAIAGVPSFTAIAKHAGQTPERLAGAIILPHPPMPAVALTNVEMRDVIAYIMTLRTD